MIKIFTKDDKELLFDTEYCETTIGIHIYTEDKVIVYPFENIARYEMGRSKGE